MSLQHPPCNRMQALLIVSLVLPCVAFAVHGCQGQQCHSSGIACLHHQWSSEADQWQLKLLPVTFALSIISLFVSPLFVPAALQAVSYTSGNGSGNGYDATP
jgi:hypothetical protein